MNNGGPAFPVNYAEAPGMTLRDYFAAKAMQVFLANDETDIDDDAKDAYMVADALLRAREK